MARELLYRLVLPFEDPVQQAAYLTVLVSGFGLAGCALLYYLFQDRVAALVNRISETVRACT